MAGDKITKIIDIKVLGTDKLHQLEAEISKSEQKLKSMTSAGKKNAGMQKIHAKNIVNTKLQLKQLRAERNLESKAIINSSTAAKKLDGSYNGLVARNKALLTTMKAAKGGMTSNTKAMQNMKKEYTDNNSKLKEFDSGLGNSQRNVGNYGSALGSMKEKFATIGMAVGGAIVAFQAISRVVTMLSEDFGKFEKGMTNVLSLMNGGDITKFGDDLKAGTLDVMKEFGLEIQDVNKALFDAVSAGVPAADAIDFLRTASELAVGGVTDLTTATDGITTVINAFGLEASEASQVASAFFTAQKFGKTTVEELSTSIGQVAPIAKQAGLGYQELLSAMAILTKQGLNTNIATSTLRATISSLMKPAEGAKKEFDRLGISYGASGLQGDGLMKIMGQISKAAETDTDALAKLIPNVQALTGVGALGTAQLQEYDEILQAVNTDYGESSSLAAAVVMQQETLEQSQKRLNSEWTAQKVMLGDKMKPVFTFMIDALSTIVKHASTITTVLKFGAGTWLVYKSAMLIGLGVTKLKSLAVSELTIKQRLLNVAVKANPYVLFASLLATAVAMLWSSSEATGEAANEQSRYNKTMEEMDAIQVKADDHLDTEISKLSILNDTILDETSSRKQKQAAINTMNENYGTSLSYMADEEKMAKALEVAYKGAIEALKSKIIMQAAQEQLVAVTKEQIKLEDELREATGLTGDATEIKVEAEKEWARLKSVQAGMLTDWMKDNARMDGEDEISHNARMFRALNQNKAYVELKAKVKTYGFETLATVSKVNGLSEKQGKLSATINESAKNLDKYLKVKKKDTEETVTLISVMKMEEKTLNDIQAKKTALSKLLKDEIIGSKEYIALETEINRLNVLTSKTKATKTSVTADAIAKSTIEVAALKRTKDMLFEAKGMEDEYSSAKVAWAKEKIRLIMLEAELSGKLTADQLLQLASLKQQIADTTASTTDEETGENILDKMFGDNAESVYAHTMDSLQTIGGLMAANNALAEAESQQKLKRISKERKAEIKDLKEGTKWETMTEEQRNEALKTINDKYDAQQYEVEKAAFERNKKMQKQQAIIAGAMAIMRLAADVPKIDYGVMTGILIAAQIGMTGMQIAAINATKFEAEKGMIIPQFQEGGRIEYAQGGIAGGGSFANGGMFSGPRHSGGGIKFSQGGTMMEAEGGEAIINRESTSMFRNELSAINQAGGGVSFADGGVIQGQQYVAQQNSRNMLSDDDVMNIADALGSQEVFITESEISGTQRTVGVLESRASF